MSKSAIRHLAILDEPAILAAAYFEKTVQIWSWKTREQLSQFDTIMDDGGRRLAMTDDGRICIAGSFRRGLAAYSIPDGNLLWHRKDLRQVQYVHLSASGSEIFCGIEKPSVHIIETETGISLGEMPHAAKVISSQVGPHQLVARREDRYTLQSGSHELEFSASSFALLSAAFSPEAVCLSEPGTGIRCVDLSSGNVLWHLPELGANEVTFNQSDRRFYCFGSLDTGPSEPYQPLLIRLADRLIDCDTIDTATRPTSAVFTPSGTSLASMDGEVYETSSGNLLSWISHTPMISAR